jgi:hypothetical protein
MIALSPLFVKVWRMSTLLNASIGFQRKVISNFQAFLYTFPLIMIEFILLFIASMVDPPRQTEKLGVGDGLGSQVVTCQQKTNIFFIIQSLYNGTIFFLCIIFFFDTDMISVVYLIKLNCVFFRCSTFHIVRHSIKAC